MRAAAIAQRLGAAGDFVSLARAIIEIGRQSFDLHLSVVSLHTPSGQPVILVDDVRDITDAQRLAWVSGLYLLDPMLHAMNAHHAPVGDEAIDSVTFMEFARSVGYTGDRIYTLLLPVIEPEGVVGSIRCGSFTPFGGERRRDLTVLAARVSVRWAQLGITHESATTRMEAISPRQHQVARLVAGGATNHEIAATLALSQNTVKKHLKEVFLRLGVGSRTELVAALHRRGLRDPHRPGVTHLAGITITKAA